MKKKLKIIIVRAIVAVVLIASVVAVAVNYHNIYVFIETKGFFRTPISINDANTNGLCEYSLDGLKNDKRVSIDQSLMLVNT